MNRLKNMGILTPAEAATRANVSRPTISRALKSSELRGIRDNSGRWRIESSDLDAWASERPVFQHEQRAHSDQNSQDEQMNGLKIALSKAEARAEAAEKRAGEIGQDRDRWQTMAEALRADLAAERSRPARPGFFGRLLGR